MIAQQPTGFSSLKKLFGGTLRARTDDALENELDARVERCNEYKVRCHL
jgi:hypothetical protein